MNAKKTQTIIFYIREYKFAKQYFGEVIFNLLTTYNIYIFHQSKLNNSPAAPVEVEDLVDIDISDLSHGDIKNIITQLDPRICLITNFRSLSDIYWFHCCKMFRVKTLYIEHGIILEKAVKFKRANIRRSFLQYFNYIKKVGSACFQEHAFDSLWGYYLALFRSNYIFFNIDNALLYAKGGEYVLNKIFDLKRVTIKYAGYPICSNDSDLKKLYDISPQKEILFIHQPLIVDNYSSLSFNEEIEIFKQLNTISQLRGFRFCIKLHPRDNYVEYKDAIPDIPLYIEEDTNELIAHSAVIVGLFSTALFTAIILKKPLLILNFGDLKVNSLDLFLKVGINIRSIVEYDHILSQLDDVVDLTKYQHFIEEFVGVKNSQENRIRVLKQILSG